MYVLTKIDVHVSPQAKFARREEVSGEWLSSFVRSGHHRAASPLQRHGQFIAGEI